MIGVILDADSLGQDIDLTPITSLMDEWHVHGSTLPDETAERIKDASVVLSNKIALNAENMSNASSLGYISVMATGTNNVDFDYCSKHNIQVSNAVAYATPSVVQHTISLILALATNLPAYLNDVRAGAWQKSNVFCLLDHPISEIAGKTLGIFGHGELGGNVAKAAEGLGMNVLLSERPGADLRDGRTGFEELLRTADYLTLHCPLTPETEHLINEETLALMKPSGFLINTARGGLVDSKALLEALEQKQLAGAAVDVLDVEPAREDEPLINAHPNLLVTPHNAWGAIESRQRLVQQMRENIEGFLKGSPPRIVTP